MKQRQPSVGRAPDGMRERAPGCWSFYVFTQDPRTGRRVRTWHTIRSSLAAAIHARAFIQLQADRSFDPNLHGLPIWTVEEMRRALLSLQGDWLYLPMMIAMVTGMRRNEVLGLFDEDLAPQTAEIYVKRSLSWIEGRPLLSRVKTPAGSRAIGVPTSVVTKIQRLARAQQVDRTIWHAARMHSIVVAGNKGGPTRPGALTSRWATWADTVATRDLGLPMIRFQDLRLSHAMALLMSGVSSMTVNDRLSGTSMNWTADRLFHMSEHKRAAAAKEIENLIRQVGI